MESLSPQVVSATKLPILNPNEFNLWKMRIEQYFLMFDYSLWEKLARKNELKARGTLLMALLDKHQLKFNIHKDAKTLMEAIEKRFSGNKETKKVQKTLLKQQYANFTGSISESLDQIHDMLQKLISQLEILGESLSQKDINLNLKIYKAEVKSSSSASTSTKNIAFESSQNTDSTNETVSVVASAKIPVSALPNVDTLKEMDLKWQMAMLTVRARRFLQRTGRNLRANRPTSMGFDMLKAEEEPTNYALMEFASSSSSSSDNEVASCSKACTKAYDTLQSHYDKLTNDVRKSQFDVISYKTRLESVEARLLVYQQNETVFEEDIKLLKLEVQLRDNALVVLRQKFKKAEQERDDLKLKLEKFQTSSKNLSQLLASQTNDKIELGYNTQVLTSSMFDCDEMFTSESDESLPPSPIYDRYQSGEGYHVVPLPYTGTYMPPKHDLVFYDVPNVHETVHTTFNVELNDFEAELTQNVPSFVQPNDQVKTPRPSVKPCETSIPAANHKTDIPKPKRHGNNKNRNACFVCKSLTHLIKDCDYYEKKMAQTPIRNHAPRGTHQQYARITLQNPQRHVVPTAVLTKSKLVPITAARPVTAAVPKPHVTRPRLAKTIVTKPHSTPRRHINRSPSPKASTFSLNVTAAKAPMGNPQHALKDKGVIDSRCSRHITGNMSYLSNFEEINGGYVAFGGNPKGGKISRKGKIRTGKLDFEDVYFVKELKFNLFSVSQICDKKNIVLFTDTECIVLSLEFKLLDENQVLLRVLRKNNMYNVDLKNIVSSGDLTCLFAKATLDESNLLHIRLGHINFKTMNKLVKGIENHLSLKVKIIRSDNRTEFKNNDLNQLCGMKGIKRKFSIPRTPQQNGIAERRNKTLIEAARTMLADSLLPIPFWAEAFNTACYVQNRVLVTKPQNKTPYELLLGRTPSIGFMRPFECLVTILNTLDPLEKAGEDNVQQYVLFPLWSSGSKNPQNTDGDAAFKVKEPEFEGKKPESEIHVSPSSSVQTKKHDDKTKREAKGIAAGPSNTVVSPTHGKSLYVDTSQYPNDPNMPELEDITYSDDEEDVGAEANFTNLEITITVSPILTTRVHKDHPVTQIIGDLSSATQTRSTKRIEAMQEELLQFKMQKVWVLVDLPNKKRAIGHTQEEGIDYEEVFAPIARIEAIRLFLAYASFMGFIVYQIDVKSAFLYRTIEEEVYVCQPLGFEDPDYPDKVYKVVKALYGLHQAPRTWYETLANYLLKNGFHRGKIDQTLFIKRHKGDILLVQIYVDDIIFGSTIKYLYKAFENLMKDKFQMSSMGDLIFFLDGKSASTPIDTEKPLHKDPDCEDVDVHTYRSMIGSFMYLTSSRPDIILDRKSTTGRCQFLGCRLISWQCKKQTVVATSSTKAEYVAAASCCAQVLWIQNQLLDYGPYQTVSGKDSSNPLMADNLPKIVWYSTYHVALIKSWLVQKQTALGQMATGKENSNPFMAAVICLSTGRKFNFSKYIFDSLVRNVDSSTKFYMYSRFLQLMIRAQVGDLSSHTTKYSSPVLTQKVFANMRRVEKGFSGVDTPLFEGMIVAQQADDVADEGATGVDVDAVLAATDKPSITSPTPTTLPPPPSQELPSTSQVIPTPPPSPIAEPSSPQQQPQPSQPSHDAEISMDLLHTLLETCTTLTRRVKHLEQDKIAQNLKITKLKQRVKKLERRNKLKVSKLRRLKKWEIIANIDADEDVTLKDVAAVEKTAEIEKDADVQGRQAESQAQIYQIDLEHADKVLSMQDDELEPAELKEIVEVVTTAKLMTEVVTAAAATITAATSPIPAAIITAAPSTARKRKRVVIRDPEETATPSIIIHSELKSKDKGKRIMVEEPKPLKKQAQIEQDEAYKRELEAELNKNIN
nr:hypothetical protein [Tanacetum cinerariifolium]